MRLRHRGTMWLCRLVGTGSVDTDGQTDIPEGICRNSSRQATPPQVSTCGYCRFQEPPLDTGFERIVLALFAAAAAGLGWGAVRLKRQLGQSERERRHATDELNRRLSELLSLRELFHVLSGSLQ